MDLPELPADTLQQLFEEGEALWQEFRRKRGAHFHPFVPADYPGAYEALRTLQPRAHSFLELGSGVGVITILADLLGYEAYGIELDPWLAEQATELAERFGSGANFAAGSFVPEEFQDQVALQSADFLTTTEGEPAYRELGLELNDFDLVYMFPWPGEEELHFEMVRRYARPDALFLTYGGTDGYQLFQRGEPIEI